MKNIEKYKDEIIEEYHNLMKTTAIDGDGNRMNKAIKTIAYKHCGKTLLGASNPFIWLCEEYNEPILTYEEKSIIKVMLQVIHKFGCTSICVEKIDIGNCDSFISIRYENHVIGTDDTISSPIIDNDKFKGMELNRKYTLEELGILCQTQKDNYVRQ